MEAKVMRGIVCDFANGVMARTTTVTQDERLMIAGMLNETEDVEALDPEMRKSVRCYTRTPINILYAARDFYALEALTAILCDANANAFDATRHSHVFWFDTFSEFRNMYAAKLANAIFDYTVSVVAGEMRHARREAGFYIEDFPYGNGVDRCTVYENLDEYEPYSVLAAASAVFDASNHWGDGFGGPKWKQIADAGLKRKTLSDVAFIDHCVDLSHNNSVYFDKGAGIFELAYANEYIEFLNLKRNAMPQELFCDIGNHVASLIRRAMALGIADIACSERSGRNTDRVLCYIPIRWGHKFMSQTLVASRHVASQSRERIHFKCCDSGLSLRDFKIGDEVVCVANNCNRTLKSGISKGIIVSFEYGDAGVKWKHKIASGHSCSGHGRRGYCWYMPPSAIKKSEQTVAAISKEAIKVGDTVQMVGEDGYVKPGSIGKILNVNEYGVLAVEWDDVVIDLTTGEIVGYVAAPGCKAEHGWEVLAKKVVKVHLIRIQKPEPKIIAIPGEISVGDSVMCVNDGQIYSLYRAWVKLNAPQYLESWEKGKDKGINKVCGTVVAMAPHTEQSKLMLYLVKVPSKGSFLIEKKGLAMVEKEVAKNVA